MKVTVTNGTTNATSISRMEAQRIAQLIGADTFPTSGEWEIPSGTKITLDSLRTQKNSGWSSYQHRLEELATNVGAVVKHPGESFGFSTEIKEGQWSKRSYFIVP